MLMNMLMDMPAKKFTFKAGEGGGVAGTTIELPHQGGTDSSLLPLSGHVLYI